MSAIKNLETKLEQLIHRIQKLESENAELQRKLGCIQESIETLEGHEIDIDCQIEKIKAHVGIEEVSPLVAKILGSNAKSYLRLVD